MWRTLLKCDNDTKGVLKDKAKQARRKEKKARKKSKRQATGKLKSSSQGGSSSDSDTSSSGSSTSSSSSSSVEASSLFRGNPARAITRSPRKRRTQRQHLPFIYVKGVPHFRSKTTGDLVNAGEPPNTPCRSCQNCHWYWQDAVVKVQGCAKSEAEIPPFVGREQSRAEKQEGGEMIHGHGMSVRCKQQGSGRREGHRRQHPIARATQEYTHMTQSAWLTLCDI